MLRSDSEGIVPSYDPFVVNLKVKYHLFMINNLELHDLYYVIVQNMDAENESVSSYFRKNPNSNNPTYVLRINPRNIWVLIYFSSQYLSPDAN